MKLSDFQLKSNIDTVMNMLSCEKGTPQYDIFLDEIHAIEPEVMENIQCKAVFTFSTVDEAYASEALPQGTPVICVLLTVGCEISRLASEYFHKGDCVRGMLADAMADDFLFQMDSIIQGHIKEECAEQKVGIIRRLEAPNDIPINMQRMIWEKTNALEELNVNLKESFMMDPVKSSSYIYELCNDESIFATQHDCRNCSALNCKMRHTPSVNIEVIGINSQLSLKCEVQQSILECLTSNNIYYPSVCGGRGTCGKCRIRLLAGSLAVTASDKKAFTEDELQQGYRLACKAYPQVDCRIRLEESDESTFEVVSDYSKSVAMSSDCKKRGTAIGIDIGTTTIAMKLFSTVDMTTIDTYTCINKQRAYGADVISRIQASNDGKNGQLQTSIRSDLQSGINTLLEQSGLTLGQISSIAIAGNTTMIHLLMGYSCESLGIFPFTPVNVKTINGSCEDIIGIKGWNVPVVVMPGISTFVGGDIVAGLYSCEFDKMDSPSLLIDLGTNGEMAIGNKNSILCTSTAAGPAFEGGNILWGTGSIAGAICKVDIRDEKVAVETIGGKPPVGICGTGVLETASEMLKAGMIDETGRLMDDYFEEGLLLAKGLKGEAITFTQKDVREIQLAKAAVRAGIEVLLQNFGINCIDVDTVYLAGGFGYNINIDKAIAIGLLPDEFRNKVKTVGNSSLNGAVKYLNDKNAATITEAIVASAKEINLSTDINFNDLYMQHMFFK